MDKTSATSIFYKEIGERCSKLPNKIPNKGSRHGGNANTLNYIHLFKYQPAFYK